MACRQNQDLWWWLYKYGIKRTIKQNVWRGGYFWEDSFKKHFYRLIRCKHPEPQWVQDEREWYCFRCHTNLPEIKNPLHERR